MRKIPQETWKDLLKAMNKFYDKKVHKTLRSLYEDFKKKVKSDIPTYEAFCHRVKKEWEWKDSFWHLVRSKKEKYDILPWNASMISKIQSLLWKEIKEGHPEFWIHRVMSAYKTVKIEMIDFWLKSEELPSYHQIMRELKTFSSLI